MAQKRQYWVDRTHAAANPDLELYVAMDGGAGNDAVLPHLSAHDLELPNKALKDASTLPAKIMNGLVHGSVRSHVILSPGNLLTARPRNLLLARVFLGGVQTKLRIRSRRLTPGSEPHVRVIADPDQPILHRAWRLAAELRRANGQRFFEQKRSRPWVPWDICALGNLQNREGEISFGEPRPRCLRCFPRDPCKST